MPGNIIHPRLETVLNNHNIPPNTLSIYHTNIRSLKNHYDDVTTHLTLYHTKPDILVLTDNYMKKGPENDNLYPIEGYHQQHTTDITIYTKQNLFTTISEIRINDAHATIIRLHTNKTKTNTTHIILCIYRRPNIDFITAFQETVEKLQHDTNTAHLTVVGDINIDHLRLPRKFHDCLTETGLHATVTTPTRHENTNRAHSKTLIDTILTTATNIAITAGTISPPITDHLQTYAIFHTPPTRRQQNKQKTLTRRQYDKHKQRILQTVKTNINTTQQRQTNTQTTSQKLLEIQLAIQKGLEQHERRPKHRRKAWCTPKFERKIRRQHQLHERAKNNPTEENNNKHRKYRNKLQKQIKQAKAEHLKTSLEDTRTDPKQQQKILESIIPGKGEARSSPTTIKYNGATHTDPKKVANALNDHYITIGHKTGKSIPHYDEQAEEKSEQNPQAPQFKLQHITEDTLHKYIKKINSNKAADIYKITPAVIRDLADFLPSILTPLFNKSIDENEYPNSLKYTKLIELYKAGDKTLPSNYRPISLLPIIAKLLDKIINDQLMDYLLTHNLISPTQYAFRPNSSTTLALQAVLNDIHEKKKKHQPILAIYVDLSKAYDTVSHPKLLHKLKQEFNFTQGTTKFFSSYFKNRQQETHTQHATSKTQEITHGIPQGSTLSTTLFLLYINNIIKTVPASKVYTYADDTTLIITAPTIQELQLLAQTELENLIKYFHKNNLVPNPTKTTYTIFSQVQNLQLTINNHTLAHTNTAKLLGIYIQDTLKHNDTITNIIKKLQRTIQAFRYATTLLDTGYMTKLYYTHVYPHLIGAISVWGSQDKTKEYLQPLIRTHKKIIRIINNVPPRTPTAPLMQKLGILNLASLFTLRVCAEMHPYIYPPAEKPLNRPHHNHTYIAITDIHMHDTRYSAGHIFSPNTNKYSKTKQPKHTSAHYTQIHTDVWNKLPANLRSTKSLTVFKHSLKKYLLEEQAHKLTQERQQGHHLG